MSSIYRVPKLSKNYDENKHFSPIILTKKLNIPILGSKTFSTFKLPKPSNKYVVPIIEKNNKLKNFCIIWNKKLSVPTISKPLESSDLIDESSDLIDESSDLIDERTKKFSDFITISDLVSEHSKNLSVLINILENQM